MFRWTGGFGSRRSSTGRQSNSSGTDLESSVDLPSANPPRYSDIPTAGTSTQHNASSEPYISSANPELWDTMSVLSLGSASTAPTYMTHDHLAQARQSTSTLRTPPRYSTMTLLSTIEGDPTEPPPTEYTFPIRGFGKSKPWATFRLFNAEPLRSRTKNRGKYPRFSNEQQMLGNVELSLESPQTIRSIKLILKGTLITAASADSGSLHFLDHTYVIWDRKFGDPQELMHGRAPASQKDSNGKLDGNWLFPFSIPFPTRVELSTLNAVYSSRDQGPVRFLPHYVEPKSSLTPFNGAEETSPGTAGRVRGAPFLESAMTPFDLSQQSIPGLSEKATLLGGAPARVTQPNHSAHPAEAFSSMLPLYQAAPTSPTLVNPYTATLNPSTPTPENSASRRPEKTRLSSSIGTDNLRRPGPVSNSPNPNTSNSSNDSPTSSLSGVLLPQSFLQRDVKANVQYEVTLLISHGRFASESRVKTLVIYAPVTRASSSMPLTRQLAYRQGTQLSPPDIDPDGWYQLPPTSIKGMYVQQQLEDLELVYTLYLSKPLSYSRGTVIPCWLTIACNNSGALGIFSDPRSPRVRLRRFIRFLDSVTTDNSSLEGLGTLPHFTTLPSSMRLPTKLTDSASLLAQRKSFLRNSSLSGLEAHPFTYGVAEEHVTAGEVLDPSSEDDEREIGTGAVWWIPQDVPQEPGLRKLMGEIHLLRGLQPTCIFPLFNVLYCVELLAPNSHAFEPDLPADTFRSRSGTSRQPEDTTEERDGRVYASRFVNITTEPRRDEPIPTAFTERTE
ncbi:hypothetical protein D9611_008920 [Ephemerocybe angulata]|uniref:Arrestin-like N-terminal domain-containing protein n=1 Tax=Ephemerocybe angulata TaxID=980116 RepID=A0A8H5FCW0_9AGAR|nr:hypothetical protein D9611_008920 [Tulosesus angulatus]